MIYMLDTNICIYLIKNKPQSVIEHFLSLNPEELCISSITFSELVYGVEKSQAVEKNRLALSLFLSNITILPYDHQAALHYGNIRAILEKQGTPIGGMDMLIAGHARSKNLILVTNNTREFARVPDLALENWV